MQHKPFYQVPLDCYLFGENHKPEDKVTQWVIFELIRYYGYSIDQLEVEKTVQYGTCRGWLDILVRHNDKPFIVIECKRHTGYIKNKDHMKQAISYANADSIQFKLSFVYLLMVISKTAAGWVNYPNIPRINEQQETEFEFSTLQHDLDDIKPVLHWLYQPISGADAYRFIKAIQPIFCAHSIITNGTNETLLTIIDHVCRALTIKTK